MPIDLNQIDQLDAIGKAIITLRRAVADAGGEVIAVQHRVGTHKFAAMPPAGAPDSDEERSGAGGTGKDETASDGVPVPVSGETPEKITGKRKAAE